MLYDVDGRCLRAFICRKVVAGGGRRSVVMMTARSTKRATLARAMAMAITTMTSAYHKRWGIEPPKQPTAKV
jgi:hypothetical protein